MYKIPGLSGGGGKKNGPAKKLTSPGRFFFFAYSVLGHFVLQKQKPPSGQKIRPWGAIYHYAFI